MTRNRRKMIKKTVVSLLLSKHSIQFSALCLPAVNRAYPLIKFEEKIPAYPFIRASPCIRDLRVLTLQAARVRRQEEERDVNGTNGGDSSRGSTPTPVPPGADRVTSPPIPAIRNSQGGGNSSNNSEFESGSMGLSSDDDQVQNQLHTYSILIC